VKPKEILYQMQLQSSYKRINFKYSVIPRVKKAITESGKLFHDYGVPEPHLSVLSENWLSLRETTEKEYWTDSISINFGYLPLRIEPIVPVKNRTRVVSEKQSSLVFSQSISGEVIALIYPPNSEFLETEKKCYVFDRWGDPHDITIKDIINILEFTLEINTYTQSLVFPNPKGVRNFIKLQVKDNVLSNGGSRMWVWITYLTKVILGVARMHGIGKPI
jgi:hypothetical protein